MLPTYLDATIKRFCESGRSVVLAWTVIFFLTCALSLTTH